eukprot:TRINITY_DN3267_c1_g1_i1.p1 TRINITY_DN3267_c1_g1~~TRINITY_DN3267_c1_g1_i1.p1  ORF type:complete len:871 (+),score=121.74 TRINITY_DN3267_c1_g1_i1:78-2690(+)
MSAEQEDDMDNDAVLDEDPDTIQDVEKARARIRQLAEERTRKIDYQTRLNKKLLALDHELAGRREQVEDLHRSLMLERNRVKEEHSSLKKERDAKARMQEERIREYLTEVLYAKENGGKKGSSELDTVKVSFVKPNESYRYNLAFRIDAGITISELRKTVCKYWGVSADNFILRTMANNKCQDDNKVKDCFKQGEIAQLRLEMKNKDSTAPPLEEELKAIQPKGAKRRAKTKGQPRYNAEGVDKIHRLGDNYSGQLKKMGGIYFLLKLRDTKPSEHAAKIKLRDIVIYTLLVALTFYVYTARRPAGHSYWASRGVEEFFLRPYRKTDMISFSQSDEMQDACTMKEVRDKHCTPSFEDLTTHDEVWDWLNYSIPAILWKTDSNPNTAEPSVGMYNKMLGYINIRVQNTKPADPPDKHCFAGSKEFVKSLAPNVTFNKVQAVCYARVVDATTQSTAEFLNISNYWAQVTAVAAADQGAVVRGPCTPGKFVSASKHQKDSGVDWMRGRLLNYDASGYSVSYRMEVTAPANATRDYLLDMDKFRAEGWISQATRAIMISFTTYNYHYDLWTANDYLIELPPSGDVSTTHKSMPFRPRVHETKSELTQTYLDYGRVCICIYILLFVGWLERQHKVRNHKAGAYYHVSLTGITDLGMSACVIIAKIWRSVSFESVATGSILERTVDLGRTKGFISYSATAAAYNVIFVIDGVMMVFVMYRMISFFRLSHTIYLLWHTLGEALKALIFFSVLLVPTMLGFIIVTNGYFGPYLESFAMLGESAIMCYNAIVGRPWTDAATVGEEFTLVVVLGLYFIVSLLLLNVFATCVVDAYYVVQLTSISPTEKWDKSRFARWAIPGLCISIYQAVTTSGNSEGRG